MNLAGWDDGSVAWSSGAWSLELRGDELADLAYDGRPVLRSIRAVVRDRDWNTAGWELGAAETGTGMLRLPLRSTGYGSDVRGDLVVKASGNRVTVTFDAVSETAFATNRTGLVVLHPHTCAGAALRVEHGDGAVEHTRFPVAISPHQPVFDIAGLAWESGGVAVKVRFSGDTFEMEDQRNWTDASFKTYSRPLALPFPYELAAGERVVQSLVIEARPVDAVAEASASDDIRLRPAGSFPAVAVSASTAPDPAPAPVAVGGGTLVELDLGALTWRAALDRAAAAGLPLDIRFVLSPDEPHRLADGVRALVGHDVSRVSAFWNAGPARHVADAAATDLLRGALAEAGLALPVVGGVRSHFTELNREQHRLADDLDGIVFSVTPLFHSLSTAQLVESVPMQRVVAAQAVRIAGGLPVFVGPVSLRPHFNDVATTPEPVSPHPDLRAGYGPELIEADDPRQETDDLAAWTIASAAALAVPGVAGLAFFEEWGPRGLRTSHGAPLPVAAAVEALAALAGAELLAGDSPDGLVWALGARSAAGCVVLAANLDLRPRPLRVDVDGRVVDVHVGARRWERVAVTS